MSFILDLIHDQKIGLAVVFFLVFVSCAGVLINEQSNYNLFTSLYNYVPCNVLVTKQIIQPLLINISADLVPTTCFHTHNHPTELQIGSPPPVNALLWIGICLGLAGGAVMGYLIKTGSD